MWLLLILLIVVIIVMFASGSKDGFHFVGDKWLNMIKDGTKTINPIVGVKKEFDVPELVFGNRHDEVKVKVLKVNQYDSLEDLLKGEDFKAIMPTAKTAQEVQTELSPYFPPERLAGVGLCAVHVKVLEIKKAEPRENNYNRPTADKVDVVKAKSKKSKK
jgi:ASC-1-like (ASCH) protein